MFVLIAGLATAFNFIIIFWKFEHGRTLDSVFDLLTFVAISVMFAGTMEGMSIGMIASAFISTYLLIKPPKFSSKIFNKFKARRANRVRP